MGDAAGIGLLYASEGPATQVMTHTRVKDVTPILDAAGQRQWYEIEMGNLLAALQENQAVYEMLIDSPGEEELYQGFRTNWNRYYDQHTQVIALTSAGKPGVRLARHSEAAAGCDVQVDRHRSSW